MLLSQSNVLEIASDCSLALIQYQDRVAFKVWPSIHVAQKLVGLVIEVSHGFRIQDLKVLTMSTYVAGAPTSPAILYYSNRSYLIVNFFYTLF